MSDKAHKWAVTVPNPRWSPYSIGGRLQPKRVTRSRHKTRVSAELSLKWAGFDAKIERLRP